MGEIVRIDDRWRITIPARFRKGLKPGDILIIERRGEKLILRKFSREDILKRFNEIRLVVDDRMRALDAGYGKHTYGGIKE